LFANVSTLLPAAPNGVIRNALPLLLRLFGDNVRLYADGLSNVSIVIMPADAETDATKPSDKTKDFKTFIYFS
jgi:hypothetical protein